ncbi:MAG: cysteine desulfurase [Elusimicrobia bacterium]|nr:cysteine desulfurase [Elusimicrobiota bacterium]
MRGDGPRFDAQKLRLDFPALARLHLGRPVVYLDNACMTLPPAPVLEAMARYYREHPGCHGRSNHLFGRETTTAFNAARAALQRFVGAARPEEVVFTKNATEAVNLVAHCWPWKEGDAVVCTDLEHNSDLLPWRRLQESGRVTLRVVRTAPDTSLDLESLRSALDGRVRLVALPQVSNLSGVALPVREVCALARTLGVRVLVDGTQAVPHVPVDVRELGADFYVFSAHKMLGPAGMGCLYGRRELLAGLPPFLSGGETVSDVGPEACELLGPPERFEAGLQNYAGALGFARAAEYLSGLDRAAAEAHVRELNRLATEPLAGQRRFRIIGPRDPARRGGILNFVIEGLDSHDAARILDSSDNIMLRAGRHCVHSWYRRNGVADSLRASFYIYNTREEAELFAAKVRDLLEHF